MLLARAGLSVRLLERSARLGDVVSGHLIKPTGVARLRRWNLLDAVLATGCPALDDRVLWLGGQPHRPPAPAGPRPDRTAPPPSWIFRFHGGAGRTRPLEQQALSGHPARTEPTPSRPAGQRRWRQLQVHRQGQVTDRYTKAVDQLGQAGLEVKVGGIYALERIARDSLADRLTIVEILTTFIRLHSPLSPGTDQRQRPPSTEAKLSAARTKSLAGNS